MYSLCFNPILVIKIMEATKLYKEGRTSDLKVKCHEKIVSDSQPITVLEWEEIAPLRMPFQCFTAEGQLREVYSNAPVGKLPGHACQCSRNRPCCVTAYSAYF